MTFDLDRIGVIITAIGGLGLASFALVDASKALPGGGASNTGFDYIERAVRRFLPASAQAMDGESLADSILQILHANWINGMALADQRAIAKSLLKLKLGKSTAAQFALATEVAEPELAQVAERMTSGEALSDAQMNVLGRFDLALTAILDAAYQRADQRYRNISRAWAAAVSVLLAVIGGWLIDTSGNYFASGQVVLTLFCGILSVPLAPIAKDMTSALSAGVKMAQAIKR
jgi:hypothetical protein